MKVMVISSSLRAGSNSELMAEAFAEGAKAAGHEVQLVKLKGKKINYCLGCYGCAKTHRCVQKDDATELVQLMRDQNVLAFATPVYFYGISAQLKALLDRTVAIYDTTPKFGQIVLLSCAGEDAPRIPDDMQRAISGWIDCFPGVSLRKSIVAGGFQDAHTVSLAKLKECREAGEKL